MCPFCQEPASHHRILDKEVDVGVWHSVWQGKARWLRPSDAELDWDLPVTLAPVDVEPVERHARPFVPVPGGVGRPLRAPMARQRDGKFLRRLLDRGPDHT